MAPLRIRVLALGLSLAFMICLTNFGLFIFFYHAITGDLLSEYWKRELVGYVFGQVLIGYGAVAVVVSWMFTWLAVRLIGSDATR